MKILLTGVTGYIGKRLLPVLVNKGFTVVCCVRDASRLQLPPSLLAGVEIIEADFLEKETLNAIPADIDGAFYLIHSMSVSKHFKQLEQLCAVNFREAMDQTDVRHVIYLSGIINEQHLSEHLDSRRQVESELKLGRYHLTTLRAGIIIGSGSASFEIIRDLVEKLPVMVAPKWLHTRCQPIGIADVIRFLVQTLFNEKTYDNNFDIGGPDILNYKEMLMGYARTRGIKRYIWVVPVMTPRLSSYWLYFITSTSFKLASALVDSMKIEVVCENDMLNHILGIDPIGYEAALKRTLTVIEENQIISSWKDAMSSGDLSIRISDFLTVPTHGCFRDQRVSSISDIDACKDAIWRIGGENGWYYANWLWRIRGFVDKIFGGVGLRRGRTHSDQIAVGEAIDFWRVLYANKSQGRLLLFAEMRLPGEAWLEFTIRDQKLYQTATFRPKGILGRLYWVLIFPLHAIIFRGMVKRIANP